MIPNRYSRFGVSTLSKKNKDEALTEELMSIKELGMQFMRSPDGDIVSFDKLSRETSHAQYVSSTAMSLGIFGKVVKLNFEDMPKIIEYDEELIKDEKIQLTLDSSDKPTRLYLSLDIESIEVADGTEAVTAMYQPMIHCVLERIDSEGNTIDEKTIDDYLIKFNMNTISFNEYVPSHDIFIKELSIKPNPENLDIDKPLRHVFYSAIVAYK